MPEKTKRKNKPGSTTRSKKKNQAMRRTRVKNEKELQRVEKGKKR